MMMLDMPPADRHSPLEDALSILTGVTLMALAVMFLRSGALITGQIAGLSLVIAYPTGWSWGAVFVVLNLPFYWVAVKRMGWRFTIKSFCAVSLLSVLTEILPRYLTLDPQHPIVAAIMAGVLSGVGLLLLFRHGATLGGVGIVALWLQDARGIKAGNIQLGFDLCVFAIAFALFDWRQVCWSLLGAVILNAIITLNHRRDRYIARS